MQVTISEISIRRVAAALPRQEMDLREFSQIFRKEEVHRIIKDTGVEKVRIASPKLCTSDLCERAAQTVIDGNINKIGGIIFVSQTPDYILPPTSVLLQHRLGLSKEIVAFDINYGCSGYIYGLYQAALLINSGSCETVLVCTGDVLSRFINPRDRSLRMLFGDAGSATLVSKGEDELTFRIMSDGSGGNFLIVPAGGCRNPRNRETGKVKEREFGNLRSDEDLFMDGMEILKFVLSEVPKIVEHLLVLKGWSKSEVGLFGFHQANKMIIEYLIKKMKLDKHAVPIALRETGNTGPASIPLLLAIERERLLRAKRLEKTLLCGFGTGFSCAAMAGNLLQTEIFDPIEV